LRWDRFWGSAFLFDRYEFSTFVFDTVRMSKKTKGARVQIKSKRSRRELVDLESFGKLQGQVAVLRDITGNSILRIMPSLQYLLFVVDELIQNTEELNRELAWFKSRSPFSDSRARSGDMAIHLHLSQTHVNALGKIAEKLNL